MGSRALPNAMNYRKESRSGKATGAANKSKTEMNTETSKPDRAAEQLIQGFLT
jgi:hypothetical protein